MNGNVKKEILIFMSDCTLRSYWMDIQHEIECLFWSFIDDEFYSESEFQQNKKHLKELLMCIETEITERDKRNGTQICIGVFKNHKERELEKQELERRTITSD